MTRRLIFVLTIVAASLISCRDQYTPRTSEEPPQGSLTFTRNVAPILFRECAACHHPDGAAPFSVLDYQQVKRRARTIAAVTARRIMPPWLPEHGYGEFAGERRLTEAEIDTIGRWEQQGAAEGDPNDLPQVPHFTQGWQLGEPDLVVKLPQPYTLRADGGEVWRNFVIPIPVRSTQYVKTVELRPGSTRSVHHALIGIDSTRSSRRRDRLDAEPGFAGMDMGDAQAPDGHLLGWTPGMAPFPGVKDKAWRLEPGTDLVLQLHMLPTGRPEVIDPVIGFYFADAPPVGPAMYLMRLDADQAIDIPPGDKHFVVTDSVTLPIDVDVLAVYPHAHFLAKTMEAVAKLPDGTEKRLLRIDDWDFKWQDVYRYAKPIPLPKGTTIGMRYSYDNSAENVRNPNHPVMRVVAGMRSSDEMAHLQLQVQPASADDLLVLKDALYRHTLTKNPRDAWTHYELGNVLREKGRLHEAIGEYRAAMKLDPAHAPTRNNLGVLLAGLGRSEEAIAQYREALRAEPDFADAHFNLGNALRSAGRVDEAIGHYREALKLEPDFAGAHDNLGQALASTGHLREAIEHFRAAVGLNAESAEAQSNLGAALSLQGKLDEAIAHFRRALQIDPNHANARKNLSQALELRKAIGSRRHYQSPVPR